jgi:hypothetical protein
MPAVALSRVGARGWSAPIPAARTWPPGRGSGWERCRTRAHRRGGSTRWPGTTPLRECLYHRLTSPRKPEPRPSLLHRSPDATFSVLATAAVAEGVSYCDQIVRLVPGPRSRPGLICVSVTDPETPRGTASSGTRPLRSDSATDKATPLTSAIPLSRPFTSSRSGAVVER